MSYQKRPILRGDAASDYENYLRTNELLNLQRGPEEWKHRDELLFTVVHQVSELWLKLATAEISEATKHLRNENLREPQRLLNRAVLCIHQMHSALDLLETMSPWDYQQVRQSLGHGSGFDSPGFNQLRRAVPLLGREFFSYLHKFDTDLLKIYTEDRKNEDLYQIAECLLEVDARISLWRFRHLKAVGRNIGWSVSGTQGTPVEILAKLNSFSFFPELWEVRTQITSQVNSES